MFCSVLCERGGKSDSFDAKEVKGVSDALVSYIDKWLHLHLWETRKLI